jgi:hypothetical protein
VERVRHRAAPLLLFDAINGPKELATLRATLTAWLEEDRRHLLAAKDPAAELTKRGLKFRSTYSKDSADAYQKKYVTEKVSGSHHHQIGARHPADATERDKAGVPKYTPGTGNLEKALKGLPADARRRVPQHALLELDPEEVLV